MDAEPNTFIQDLKRRYDGLKSDTERANAESKWEQIAEVISPRKQGFTGQRTAGDKRMQKVYDSTGIHSCELLSAGLHGNATNPAMKWFSLRTADDELNEQDGVKGWLSDVEKRMRARMYAPGSNFTTALHEIYQDLSAFGTAIMFVGTKKNGGLMFQARTLAECVIAENSEGTVDTVFRATEYTVRQVVQMWKLTGVSDKIREMWAANKYDEKIKVVHAVYPREDRNPSQKDAKNMAVASCYFEHDTGHELEQSGFPEFPYLVVRWSKLPGETYGRGPGEVALPDVRMLQAQMLTFIKTMQKNADPPIFVPDDGVIGPVRTVPGGLNFYRGARDIQMFPTSIQGLQALSDGMEELRNRIRTTFYTDVLSIVTDREMTATEVMERTQRQMQLLGPLLGRLEAELLGPLVTRVFGIMYRSGELPDPPEDLGDEDFEVPLVEYVSPIATAQKQREAEGVIKVAQHLQMMMGPEIAAQVLAKRVSPERTVDWLWDLFNNDPDLLLNEGEMAGAEQGEQATQMAALADPMAGAAQKGAAAIKSLTEAAGANGAPADVAGMMANGATMQ